MEMHDPEILRSLSDQRLHVIVLPTEACNFRCTYCYEEFRYARMEDWVVQGLRRLLARRAAGLAQLEVSWFGGEPTLASDIILDVMKDVRELAAANSRLTIASDMTTNGFLLARPLFDTLVTAGVRHYQISFDGPREWHDRKRVRHGGRGTFDRIWANLLAMREATGAFTITARIHVDAENREAIPGFLETFAECFGSDPRFEVFIRTLSRLGGPADAGLPVLEIDEGRRVVEGLRYLASRLGLCQIEAKPSRPICYAAKANSFVVRADGRLNKCTVALEHPNNQVGRIREDGTVVLEKAPMLQWMRGLRSEDPAELKCPMIGWADARRLEPARTLPLLPTEVAS